MLERHLSVRQTEELVRRRRRPGHGRRVPLTPDLADLEAQLRGLLATKVGIVASRRGGRLVIEFYSDEELDRIYTIIAAARHDLAPTGEFITDSPIAIEPIPSAAPSDEVP